VLTPSMTSVWPALCPPWKRTTADARSVSRSTILPLPSSPHWVPITTTFLPIDFQPCQLHYAVTTTYQYYDAPIVAHAQRAAGAASGTTPCRAHLDMASTTQAEPFQR